MSENQRIEMAASALTGLMTKEAVTTEPVTGGKHDANACGGDSGCLGQTP